MTIYVDSGVLLKAYLEEAGSDRATDSRPRGGSGRKLNQPSCHKVS